MSALALTLQSAAAIVLLCSIRQHISKHVETRNVMRNQSILPEALVGPLAVLLPLYEIAVALVLIALTICEAGHLVPLGRLRAIAAVGAASLGSLFLAYLFALHRSGYRAECGCNTLQTTMSRWTALPASTLVMAGVGAALVRAGGAQPLNAWLIAVVQGAAAGLFVTLVPATMFTFEEHLL